MSTPNKQRGFAQGEPGESAFHSPLMTWLRENELPDAFKKVEGLDDHRLLSMVTALLLEERIDKTLSAFFPRYNGTISETSFHTKLSVLEALNFLPPHIIAACRIVQKIRNSFAHELSRTKFTDIDPKTLAHMPAFLGQIGLREKTGGKDEAGLLSDFKFTSFIAISCIEAYRPNFEMTRKRIELPEFADAMNRELKERFDKHQADQRAKGALDIVKNGTMWEWRYEGFCEINDNPPPVGFKPRASATSIGSGIQVS